MTPQDTILIVEDERDLAETLAYNLKRHGYHVLIAETGKSALEAVAQYTPKLIILDVMLPDMMGTEVCQRLRHQESTRHIPILMATALGEENDRVEGFEAGADDYVTKPYSVRELELRIRAILRRSGQKNFPHSAGEIKFGDLQVDTSAHRVLWQSTEIKLTALEFKLLLTLLMRKGRVQTREILLHDVWDIKGGVMTRTVDAHIKRLREKLKGAGHYIETMRGVGYRFKAEP